MTRLVNEAVLPLQSLSVVGLPTRRGERQICPYIFNDQGKPSWMDIKAFTEGDRLKLLSTMRTKSSQ